VARVSYGFPILSLPSSSTMRTMVFTDLVNSTAVKAALTGADLHQRNQAFLDDIITPHRDRVAAFLLEFNGKIVERMGDGYFLMFDRATDAGRFAVALQIDAAQNPIATPLGPVQVRIGLHSGDPLPDPKLPGQYIGQEIDYAARLAALATGGQILISNLTKTLIEAERMADAKSHKHGDRNLKGIGPVPVFELLYAGKSSQPLREAALAPENLPPPPLRVTGRTELLAELRERLHLGGAVILKAEGGMGKTTLALATAHDALRAGEFPGGAAWVNCETGPTLEDSLRQIAAVFFGDRCEPEPSVELGKRIVAHLAGERSLVVLDNFETIAADSDFIRWLAGIRAPARVLITTRETPAGLVGKVIAVRELAEDAAIALFLTLTSEAGMATAPSAEMARDLCREVGYQPLAIQLLAARAAQIPCARLLERLRQGVGVLDARGDPTRPARHLSLRACVGVSFESLTPEARDLLLALSVLPAPFAPDAISAIVGNESWDEPAEELVNASLWRLVGDTYSVHPLVRQCALERLADRSAAERRAATGMAEAVRAQRSRAEFGPGYAARLKAYLDWCSTQLPNITAAIGYARAHEESHALLDFAKATAMFWNVQGHWPVALQLAEAARAAALRLESPMEEAHAWGNLGSVYRHIGRYREAETANLNGLAACDRAADSPDCASLRAQFHAQHGKLLSVVGRHFDVAAEHLDKALAGFRALGDRHGEVVVLTYLGQNAKFLGQFDAAIGMFEEALPKARALESVHLEREILHQLGDTEMLAGRYADAERHLQASLELATSLDNREAEARCYSNQGYIALKTGHPEKAIPLLEKAARIHRVTGFRVREGRAFRRMAEAAMALGDRAAAVDFAKQAISIMEQTESSSAINRARRILGELRAGPVPKT
jgi:class 3 adenylate cyclase/tetratricopeptide (TPR) repeat protein